MNKHIELVKKWLADPESVTKKDMEANAVNTTAADAAAYAAESAAYWAKRCEELKEQGK